MIRPGCNLTNRFPLATATLANSIRLASDPSANDGSIRSVKLRQSAINAAAAINITTTTTTTTKSTTTIFNTSAMVRNDLLCNNDSEFVCICQQNAGFRKGSAVTYGFSIPTKQVERGEEDVKLKRLSENLKVDKIQLQETDGTDARMCIQFPKILVLDELPVIEMNIRRVNLSARLHTNETYESYFKRRIAAVVSNYCEQQADECMAATLRLKRFIKISLYTAVIFDSKFPIHRKNGYQNSGSSYHMKENVVLLNIKPNSLQSTIIGFVITKSQRRSVLSTMTILDSTKVKYVLSAQLAALSRILGGVRIEQVEMVIMKKYRDTDSGETTQRDNLGLLVILSITAAFLTTTYTVAAIRVCREIAVMDLHQMRRMFQCDPSQLPAEEALALSTTSNDLFSEYEFSNQQDKVLPIPIWNQLTVEEPSQSTCNQPETTSELTNSNSKKLTIDEHLETIQNQLAIGNESTWLPNKESRDKSYSLTSSFSESSFDEANHCNAETINLELFHQSNRETKRGIKTEIVGLKDESDDEGGDVYHKLSEADEEKETDRNLELASVIYAEKVKDFIEDSKTSQNEKNFELNSNIQSFTYTKQIKINAGETYYELQKSSIPPNSLNLSSISNKFTSKEFVSFSSTDDLK
ncbi:hypothetical protein DINM_002397 [Dirofilaria immitis]|nr:hypothetical protein [Dirofilaria immitis]